MSLKQVHVMFIGAATLLALLLAIQAFASYRAGGELSTAAAGIGALASAALLVRLEVLFLRRCRTGGVR